MGLPQSNTFEFMPTLTKWQNTTILGSGDLISAQWSHLRRFYYWRPSFADNGFPPFKSTTQNQKLFLLLCICISCQPRLKKPNKLQLGNHRLVHVVRDFRPCDVMTKVRYFLRLHFQFSGPSDAHRVKIQVDQDLWKVSRSCSTSRVLKL